MAFVWAGTLGLKIGAKLTLNACVPGSGAAVEFAEALKCFIDGDNVGGAISTISGIADLVTLGLVSTTKEVMKESARGAVKQTAKETAKSAGKAATKKVGQDLSKELAMGAIKNSGKEAAIHTAKETAKAASKEATKKVGQQIGKEIARGVVPDVVEDVFRAGTKMTVGKMGIDALLAGISSGGREVTKTTLEATLMSGMENIISETVKQSNKKVVFELTKDAAKAAAMEEFSKTSYRFIAKDVVFSGIKGAINGSANTHNQ